ncbi:hypothetical protein BAGA_24315 [Bacillus gaemokensis]|uniref:Resolvase/invertase-type recombinase catalytic domain-containing protein n=1 Tax=Bacillus gaemokensis TaxID=574375 RepID=A0A073KE32_9BACI|nr:hypothetical protein BAGA_24315 [Bacillus gaemokensis]KYG34601.1 hypothetical protein AZF08_09415 [Bacillus gaemokensis]
MVTNIRGIPKVANIYGYIRVSTKDQNEQRQLHKMMERGVEARRIFGVFHAAQCHLCCIARRKITLEKSRNSPVKSKPNL